MRRLAPRIFALCIIITSIFCAIAAALVPTLLARVVVEYRRDLSPFVIACVEHRAWLPLTALPAFAIGIALLLVKKRTWTLTILGSVALLLPFLLTIYLFIALLAPLYSVHDL